MLTGAAPVPPSGGHSIYKLQGRNADLTIATTGNAKKTVVSTLNERTDEKGVTQHEYYHTSKLQPDGTVLDEDKFWFTESPIITNGTELNKRVLTRWCQVKVRRRFIPAPRLAHDVHPLFSPMMYIRLLQFAVHLCACVPLRLIATVCAGQRRCAQVQQRDLSLIHI